MSKDADILQINATLSVPRAEFSFHFARSQGPGGQNVNKVNTKAALRWPVISNRSLPDPVRSRFLDKYRNRITKEGVFVISSQRHRDQGRNIDDCLQKLRALIMDVAEPPKMRKPSKPSYGSRIRRRKAKEANSTKKALRRPPRMD